MARDSPRTACERWFARRRQVQPDVIRSFEGALHGRNDHESTGVRVTPSGARRAPHHGSDQSPTRACYHRRRCHGAPPFERPRSTKPTPTCSKSRGCSKVHDAFRPKPRRGTNASMHPRRRRRPREKTKVFSRPYNARAEPRAAATRYDRQRARRLQRDVRRFVAGARREQNARESHRPPTTAKAARR